MAENRDTEQFSAILIMPQNMVSSTKVADHHDETSHRTLKIRKTQNED